MTSSDPTIRTLRRALGHVERYVEGLQRDPVGPQLTTAELRTRLSVDWSGAGVDPERVIDELVAATDGGLIRSSGGRFFAWVIGGSLPSALAADWLISTWDQNAVLSACGPAVAVAEEIAGEWLKQALELPREASFAFTTGCQLAHFVGLAAGRQAVLGRVGWDLEECGLSAAPRTRLLISDLRHRSVDRAIKYLGFGRRDVVLLPTNSAGQIERPEFIRALEAERTPTIVVLNAGDINVAAIDCFAELIPRARAQGAWVHVDGAFGLIACASRSKRSLLAGIAEADSWATDAHKWLNVPFDCGMVFVRDRDAHRGAMSIRADYIQASTDAHDAIDWTPEWSRRARGVVVYAALRELGRDGLERLVDSCCAHARELVERIGSLPTAEVLQLPTLNQGLVRFLDPRPGAHPGDHDRRTETVIAAINATGEAFFSPTTWQQCRAMRVSVVNWRTSREDLVRAVCACEQALKQPTASGGNS